MPASSSPKAQTGCNGKYVSTRRRASSQHCEENTNWADGRVCRTTRASAYPKLRIPLLNVQSPLPASTFVTRTMIKAHHALQSESVMEPVRKMLARIEWGLAAAAGSSDYCLALVATKVIHLARIPVTVVPVPSPASSAVPRRRRTSDCRRDHTKRLQQCMFVGLLRSGRCWHCLHGWKPMGGWRFGNTIDGCQAEYVLVLDAMANLEAVPDGLTDEEVLMCPDIMSTGFGGAESGAIRFGDTVAVFAQGPTRLCATVGAKPLMGATSIIGVETVPERMAVARRLGADHVIDCTPAI